MKAGDSSNLKMSNHLLNTSNLLKANFELSSAYHHGAITRLELIAHIAERREIMARFVKCAKHFRQSFLERQGSISVAWIRSQKMLVAKFLKGVNQAL